MKRARLVTAAAWLAGAAMVSDASAQTMYRCGNTFQDKPCADGQGRVIGTPPPAPKAPAPASAPGQDFDKQWTPEQRDRDMRAAHEKNMVYHRQQCARGDQGSCIALACEPAAFDDSDAALITCIKARGYRMGNGWYTPSGWEQTPEVPRSDWRITIECIRKVAGQRPYENLYRKYDAPEHSVDLEAEAARICGGSPAPRRRK